MNIRARVHMYAYFIINLIYLFMYFSYNILLALLFSFKWATKTIARRIRKEMQSGISRVYAKYM